MRKLHAWGVVAVLACAAAGSMGCDGDGGGRSSISTIAGQPGGAGFADGSGLIVRFDGAGGVATGSLFIADTANHVVRAVEESTGTVRTIAGKSGVAGFRDGSGESARFNSPVGILEDGGDVFVVDAGLEISEEGTRSCALRKVDPETREVTTLAGFETCGGMSPADVLPPEDAFDEPRGLVLVDDTFYVADSENHVIRQVPREGGEITTLAGSAGESGYVDGGPDTALFDQPRGIATDGVTLFVAERGNHAIRQVTIATGEVSTLAGNFTTDSDGNRTPRSRPEDQADGDGSGAGEDGAYFTRPAGVAFRSGSLLVADTGDHTLRRIDLSTAEVETVAGSPGETGNVDGGSDDARFDTPGLLTVRDSTLLVADTGNSTIRRVDLSDFSVSTGVGNGPRCETEDGGGRVAAFCGPTGMDAGGRAFYVVEIVNDVVRKVTADGEATLVAGDPEEACTGSPTDCDGVGESARFSIPRDVSFVGEDPVTGGEALYVADGGTDVIRHVDLSDQTVTTLDLSADEDAPELDDVRSVLVRSGVLYVADETSGSIVRSFLGDCDPQTFECTYESFATGFSEIRGMTIAGGFLYAADIDSGATRHTIKRVPLSGGEATVFAGNPPPAEMPLPPEEVDRTPGHVDGSLEEARFDTPSDVVADFDGNLYVSDLGNAALRKILVSERRVTTVSGLPDVRTNRDGGPETARLNQPWGLAWASMLNRLGVGDREENVVRVFVP